MCWPHPGQEERHPIEAGPTSPFPALQVTGAIGERGPQLWSRLPTLLWPVTLSDISTLSSAPGSVGA